jgi:hypothetical protein
MPSEPVRAAFDGGVHSLHVSTVAAHGISRVVAFQNVGAGGRFNLAANCS